MNVVGRLAFRDPFADELLSAIAEDPLCSTVFSVPEACDLRAPLQSGECLGDLVEEMKSCLRIVQHVHRPVNWQRNYIFRTAKGKGLDTYKDVCHGSSIDLVDNMAGLISREL